MGVIFYLQKLYVVIRIFSRPWVAFFLTRLKNEKIAIRVWWEVSTNVFLYQMGEGWKFIWQFEISLTGTGKYR